MRRAIAIAFVVLTGCFGTETGNPPFAPSVGSESGLPMGIVPVVTLDAGWLAIDDVTFVPECSATGAGTIVTRGTVALDLVGAPPIEAEPVLEEGDYCAFRFERAIWDLAGLSMSIDATFGGTTPVRIRSSRTDSIALVGDAPFAMTPDMGAVLVFVDESLLFNGVSFRDAVRDADGSITISSAQNGPLLDRIEAQLAGSLFLYRDADGDGSLSSAELAAGPLATSR